MFFKDRIVLNTFSIVISKLLAENFVKTLKILEEKLVIVLFEVKRNWLTGHAETDCFHSLLCFAAGIPPLDFTQTLIQPMEHEIEIPTRTAPHY